VYRRVRGKDSGQHVPESEAPGTKEESWDELRSVSRESYFSCVPEGNHAGVAVASVVDRERCAEKGNGLVDGAQFEMTT